MNYNKIIYQKQDKIVTIFLNSPKARNALDIVMRKELVKALEEAENDFEIRVVIIRGKGEHFCAGGNIKDQGPGTVFERRKFAAIGIEAIKKIFTMDKPVIAAVDGYALGAGLSFVLAADMAIATDRAKFSQAFINVGLTPDYGSCYFLPRVVGLKKAKELTFTGDMISADEALDMGIVNNVVSFENLDEQVNALAVKLANSPAKALALGKRLFNNSWESNLDAMFELELMSSAMCFQTQDHKEGMEAFIEKREPVFKGK